MFVVFQIRFRGIDPGVAGANYFRADLSHQDLRVRRCDQSFEIVIPNNTAAANRLVEWPLRVDDGLLESQKHIKVAPSRGSDGDVEGHLNSLLSLIRTHDLAESLPTVIRFTYQNQE